MVKTLFSHLMVRVRNFTCLESHQTKLLNTLLGTTVGQSSTRTETCCPSLRITTQNFSIGTDEQCREQGSQGSVAVILQKSGPANHETYV